MWTFRGNPMLLAPYYGFMNPSMTHDLLYGFGSMVKALASEAGEFYSEETTSSDFA